MGKLMVREYSVRFFGFRGCSKLLILNFYIFCILGFILFFDEWCLVASFGVCLGVGLGGGYVVGLFSFGIGFGI